MPSSARFYDSVFVNYTIKQWGRRPEDLDPAVTARVPVVISPDDRYFRDPYQALPADGYTTMVSPMLDHDRITVALSTDHDEIGDSLRCKRVVFTGPIDEHFKGIYGPLPYRSLRFEDAQLPVGPYQPTAVVNYPNDTISRGLSSMPISVEPRRVVPALPGSTRRSTALVTTSRTIRCLLKVRGSSTNGTRLCCPRRP